MFVKWVKEGGETEKIRRSVEVCCCSTGDSADERA